MAYLKRLSFKNPNENSNLFIFLFISDDWRVNKHDSSIIQRAKCILHCMEFNIQQNKTKMNFDDFDDDRYVVPIKEFTR